jgi:hypothetical protein
MARQNRLTRIDQKTDEARVSLVKVESSLEATNRLLLSEWIQAWNQVKKEIEEGVGSLETLKRDFHSHSFEEWASLIQWIDSPQIQ